MRKIAALLLAAGLSTRMGTTSKALLPWGSTTLINYQVESLRNAGVELIIVVTGFQHEKLKTRIISMSNVEIIYNPLYRTGKASSIKSGLSLVDPNSIDDILVCSVDQPRDHTIIRSILDHHIQTHSLVTIPAFQGKGGHPTVFSCRLFGEMNAITDATFGLKSLIYNQPVNLFEVSTNEILIDLNTRSDYEKAYGSASH